MSIYVDFHVLQTVPPSCVNRDDTGSPKTAVYGGSVRARVSSQAWKHAMRKEFRGMFAEDDLGNRTKNVVQLVAQEMQSIDASLDEKKCLKKASDALKAAGISLKAATANTPLTSPKSPLPVPISKASPPTIATSGRNDGKSWYTSIRRRLRTINSIPCSKEASEV